MAAPPFYPILAANLIGAVDEMHERAHDRSDAQPGGAERAARGILHLEEPRRRRALGDDARIVKFVTAKERARRAQRRGGGEAGNAIAEMAAPRGEAGGQRQPSRPC